MFPCFGRQEKPCPFWANTNSNDIVKEMIVQAADREDLKRQLEHLIQGGTVSVSVHEEITYNDIHASDENLWNFLFFTGYLTKESDWMEGDIRFLNVMLPNREIRYISERIL